MKTMHKTNRTSQRGVALLIAIFALLLISGVAMSLVLMSGTETSMAANYKATAQSFYAAYAGLEEGRSRMSAGDPLNVKAFIYAPGAIGSLFPVTRVKYLLNPAVGEVVSPTNLAATNPYADLQYQQEWGVPVTTRTVTTQTLNLTVGGMPRPSFKWIRITAKTEFASGVDVDNSGGALNTLIPLFYDGSNQNLTSTGGQVFTVTALAVAPGGGRRMVQYIVAPPVPFPISAALFTQLSDTTGSTLNVTGLTEQACNVPSVYGVKSGGPITIPGGSAGNFKGSPASTQPNAPFPYNLPKLFAMLTPGASPIDGAGTNVVQTTPGNYTGVSTAAAPVVLGIKPTTNPAIPPPNQLSTYSGGVPMTYYAPGNLTLGGPSLTGPPVMGNGILMVEGNLTIDISHGFYYFGLILVKGNINIITTANTTAGLDVHGAVVGGGTFSAAAISNMGGNNFSANFQVNECLALQQFANLPLAILSFREVQ